MELLIATLLANWIGQAAGWWGPWFSSKTPARGASGGRTGPRTGTGAARKAGSWFGNASGWNDARGDAKRIHDRDEPPVTWGDAWREGMESGKQRGRDRFDAGQQRKAEKLAEREQQDAWLKRIEERAGKPVDEQYRAPFKRFGRRIERNLTCPECGHGSDLNPSREACPCESACPCGLGEEADTVGPDIEDRYPDYSKPLDGEEDKRWGAPDEVDVPSPERVSEREPVDEVAEKRRERDPDAPADPESATPADETTPSTTDEETAVTTMTAPTAPTAGQSGEIINFDSARDVLRGISGEMSQLSDAATETAAKHRATVARCDAAIDGLTAIDSDPETISDFLALREQAQEALTAAEKAQVEAAESSSYALTVVGNIDSRHGAIEEAVRSASHAAKIDAYKAS